MILDKEVQIIIGSHSFKRYKELGYDVVNCGQKLIIKPDFYFKDKNLIVEIKSKYYYNLHINKNIAKQAACLKQGYNFVFVIDKQYDDFNCLIFN